MTPPIKWEPWPGPGTRRPRNRAEMIALLGDPTGGGRYHERERPDPVWLRERTVELHGATALLPQLERYYMRVHRLVEPYLREALRRADIAAPGYITRAGVLVFRHMRDDATMPISNHAWGSAIDINAGDNAARSFRRGSEPRPWSAEWRRIWPRGVPEALVLAMESCGLRWGGRWPGFVDPMHFEWCG